MGLGRDRAVLRRDLGSSAAIKEMVRHFSRDVAQDEVLGPLFDDIARDDRSEKPLDQASTGKPAAHRAVTPTLAGTPVDV